MLLSLLSSVMSDTMPSNEFFGPQCCFFFFVHEGQSDGSGEEDSAPSNDDLNFGRLVEQRVSSADGLKPSHGLDSLSSITNTAARWSNPSRQALPSLTFALDLLQKM